MELEALAQLQALNEPLHSRVLTILKKLENWPAVSGAKPLRHGLVGHYRMRTGDYRIQFRVKGQIVIVEKIGHRDGFYGE
jgi:mRNA-degrading endonuclease RelE of RelBE toxin-antitoxin system